MTAPSQAARAQVRELVEADGETFAERAGIELADEPRSLWQLLVLTNLLSTRIRSEAALATAQELWKIGCDTPEGTRGTTWQQRVDALGRGGYRRYDFSTSTRLGENADLVGTRWHDDLRSLLAEAEESASASARTKLAPAVTRRLQEFDGIGPAGARIFLREVQGVWPQLGPCTDPLVTKGAEKAGLPTDPQQLADLAGDDMPRLCAALVVLARGH